ncbi:hypothetical protein QBC46DRAFT_410168 [Diplogelasinospora grovesii]|uniref:Uncharacterized protein n=1 Tax=Diplogelasinospora grovesii TaxID=303347 RepID=A0AAN6N636_9PEZI|nr:hypothetical protein QBC46DRAFT_410168 [Diplogelasinospora grovesii]
MSSNFGEQYATNRAIAEHLEASYPSDGGGSVLPLTDFEIQEENDFFYRNGPEPALPGAAAADEEASYKALHADFVGEAVHVVEDVNRISRRLQKMEDLMEELASKYPYIPIPVDIADEDPVTTRSSYNSVPSPASPPFFAHPGTLDFRAPVNDSDFRRRRMEQRMLLQQHLDFLEVQMNRLRRAWIAVFEDKGFPSDAGLWL